MSDVVVLLHGFPEGSYGWHRQTGPLREAGFQVIVPDQRGYRAGASSRVADYRLDLLASDVLRLIDGAGAERACIAGHDWGAMVAWWVAMQHPERVSRLAILNVPHPAIARSYLRSNLRQMLRSWYAGFFQIPALPEAWLRRNNFAALEGSMRSSAHRGTFTDADFVQYRQLWAAPGVLTGMVNWYRAAARSAPSKAEMAKRVTCPVLILWGLRDQFLEPSMAQASARWCDSAEVIEYPNATHWLQHEEAASVSASLVEWFSADRGAGRRLNRT